MPQERNKLAVVRDPAAIKAATGYRAALSFRGFRHLVAASAVSTCGDWLYNTVLLVYIYERTRSSAWVAAATIARIAPEIVLGPIAGAVADRYGRKRVMIACDLGRAALMFGLTIVALSHAPVAFALAIAFAATAIGTPFLPTALAITPALVDEDALAPANSLLSVVDSTALALGPALGGLLVVVGSAGAAFAINGVSFVLSALLLTGVIVKGSARAEVNSLRDNVVEGVRAVRSSPAATTLLALIPPTSFVPGVSFVLFVVVADELLGTGSDGATFLYAAVGAGGMAGGALAARFTRTRRPAALVGGCTAVAGMSLAAFAVAPSAPVGYLVAGLLGAAIIVGEVVGTTVVQRVLPQDVLGRYFGIEGTVIYSSILVGCLVAPVLEDSLGLRVGLVVAGAVPVVVVLVLARRLATVDRTLPRYLDQSDPRISLFHTLPIFKGLPEVTLERLALSATEERVSGGTEVLREGALADSFYVVASGTLTVLSSGERGGQIAEVNTLCDGDYFGEIGLLEHLPRTATVKTDTECVLYRIDGRAFLDAVSQAPVISGALLGGVMTRLARTHPSYRPTTPPIGTARPAH